MLKLLSRLLLNCFIFSEIKILVGSNDEGPVTLLLSYFVYDVKWETCYDFRTYTSEDEKSTMVFILIVYLKS